MDSYHSDSSYNYSSDSSYSYDYSSDSSEITSYCAHDEGCDSIDTMIMKVLKSLIDRVEADIVQENMARVFQQNEMRRKLPAYVPPSMRPHMDPDAYDGLGGMAKRQS